MLRDFRHTLNSSPLNPSDLQLQVDHLRLSFGGVTALFDVSLSIYQSEIFAIIGPNGAGKTSLLNCISGLYHPQKGSIAYYTGSAEHEVTKLKPYQIAKLADGLRPVTAAPET